MSRFACVPAGSSGVKIDLHAPGISLQCDRTRKSSRTCPYGSASFLETVLMPRKKRRAMTMATHCSGYGRNRRRGRMEAPS